MKNTQYLLLALVFFLVGSCSHKYDSNTLGLDFYQWNLWQDTGPEQGDNLPSCGWEELHRGKGKLVRIPASLEEHFTDLDSSDVFWYHCRFTLPEQWQGRKISMIFAEAGPFVEVFLNEKPAGSFRDEEGSYELDVSDVIYYTRDNHLSIRISGAGSGSSMQPGGISKTILVKSGT